MFQRKTFLAMRPHPIRKVQLILPPPSRPDTNVIKFAKWPQPLAIISLGTYLHHHNAEVEVEILDANNVLDLEQVLDRLDADVVGVSTTAAGYDHAISIAKIAKARGSSVVLGGATATALAREILTYHPSVDAVVRFDGEIAFSKYVAGDALESIENLVYRDEGEIKENAIRLPDLDALPIPDRTQVDMEPYFRNSKDPEYPICEPFSRPMNICAQKGCIWRSQPEGGCVFCSIPYFNLRARAPEQVWDEIRLLVDIHGADFIWDPSDNLVGDKEWFRQFCAAKPADLNIPYTNYVDAVAVDEETGHLLAQSGCCSVFVGMEAGDPAMLKTMNKRSTLQDNLNAMKILESHRIGVIVGVVVGVPGESKQSLANTVEFLKRISQFDNFDRMEWGSLIPFPGSSANRMLREHPALREKYKHFGNENYMTDLLRMIRDWYHYFCSVGFDDVQALQEDVVRAGLVPYEMTTYQRRSWSGTPSRVFLDGAWTSCLPNAL